MSNISRYRIVCTLSFGDVYGQIIVWLIVIFISLAAAMAMMGASKPYYALATVGIILVLSLPFLLFAFVTTLLNHIELRAADTATSPTATTSPVSGQRPAQAAS
jgi:quinol-cytochrome oxidoreductase complex cytochrome b subunit